MSDQQSIISQLTFRRARLTHNSEYSQDSEFQNAQKCSSIKSNLMCSDVDGRPSTHKLILDLDFPIEVYESSSGNNHLLFPQDLTFEGMMEILEVLRKHGIVQRGWVDGARSNGYAALRPPGVSKSNPEDNHGLDDDGNVESSESYMAAAGHARDRNNGQQITNLNTTYHSGGPVSTTAANTTLSMNTAPNLPF